MSFPAKTDLKVLISYILIGPNTLSLEKNTNQHAYYKIEIAKQAIIMAKNLLINSEGSKICS